MRLSVLMLLLILSLALLLPVSADCGCGTKCANYSDANRCTRCCTATVKRSLRNRLTTPLESSHRFLLPDRSNNLLRVPMWLQPRRQPAPSLPVAAAPSDRLVRDLEAIVDALELNSRHGRTHGVQH